MKAGAIAAHLLACCGSLVSFDAYMFGSTLNGVGQDIDILVVGPVGEKLVNLKAEIQSAGEQLPLHILCMLPSEAHESEFVLKERCVPLVDLATSVAPRA
ncbi:nucleotidyltransferase domain-containing protein [Tardiphaga sp.]|uniref:nucleotidyltransferase domain-containing protein n=1 Tax=Tardiphaga sp. TaxID=1926292 RepID=UPI00352A9312